MSHKHQRMSHTNQFMGQYEASVKNWQSAISQNVIFEL